MQLTHFDNSPLRDNDEPSTSVTVGSPGGFRMHSPDQWVGYEFRTHFGVRVEDLRIRFQGYEFNEKDLFDWMQLFRDEIQFLTAWGLYLQKVNPALKILFPAL